MPTRVLIVDDSGFFRRRLSEILEADPGIHVIGTAVDGQQAVQQVARLRPDVVTMDVHMPVMDGISAVRAIMRDNPTPVLMFSALTREGAQSTLDALEAGAVDFLPKQFDAIAEDREQANQLLRSRVHAVGGKQLNGQRRRPEATLSRTPAIPARRSKRGAGTSRRLVAIGASTGGPVALQNILVGLPADFPWPLLLIQHMPATFTPAFAQRLNGLCRIEIREARDGDVPRAGLALLAPGGQQMTVEQRAGNPVVRLRPGQSDETYKPSVDLTFSSLDQVLPGQVLAIVLTGMGSDGSEGAFKLKANGSEIWAQDEASSVVFGMPMAVQKAGLADQVLDINDIGPRLLRRDD